MRGKIIRMEFNKGFGFVRSMENNRAYFMHAKDFAEPGVFDTCQEGDEIDFLATQDGPKADGLRAKQVRKC